MTKPNFHAMTRQELRTYVLEHRDDEEAFYALADRLSKEPGVEITSQEELHQFIQKKRNHKDVKDAHIALQEAVTTGTTSLEELRQELEL